MHPSAPVGLALSRCKLVRRWTTWAHLFGRASAGMCRAFLVMLGMKLRVISFAHLVALIICCAIVRRCFPSSQYRGAPVCSHQLPICPKHHSKRPRIAYIVAGQARSFLDERGWQTYYQHVIKSFYAHGDSRVFLHLKLGRGPSLNRRWQELSRAVEGLRPAVVRTTLERDVDLRASVLEHQHDGGRGRPAFEHPQCFWRDEAPHFVLSRARIWWLAMAQAWESVEAYERDHGLIFDAAVFSRPDITYTRAMGPWCAYDLKGSWYAPWGEMVPDMFWIFPRSIAARVLTTWTKVVLPCRPGDSCCNLTTRQGELILGRSANIPQPSVGEPVTFSNWMSTYWTRTLWTHSDASTHSAVATSGGATATPLADALAGLNYSLRGHGKVAANPNRVIFGKPRRNVSVLKRALVCISSATRLHLKSPFSFAPAMRCFLCIQTLGVALAHC